MFGSQQIETIIISHPKIWFWLLIISVLYFILGKIVEIVGNVSKIKAKLYVPLSQWFKFSILQRAAIKHDIQGKVNNRISVISKELLSNNIKPLEIEWVKSQISESFIQEGKILVRMRPLEDQDDNIINITRPYLESVLIPKAKLFLQDSQINAIVDFSTKEVLIGNDKLINRFHDVFYLPDCKKYKKIESYFNKITLTNDRGLFYSVFITALEYAAEKSRFKKVNLSEDYIKILDHLINFVEGLSKFEEATQSGDKWRYGGSTLSYSLLLVAAPVKAARGNTDAYIKRAEEKIKSSDLLFVAFSNKEKQFGNLVAKQIEDKLNVNLVDELITKHDYRKNMGGVVRVYIKK
ncbi:MAG: hypothetical protein PHS06_01270 [Candidatus Shapirobacteria bacterium]|nr:hypothetical protein [Candidatus Shapirobacteria bacterium]